MPNSSNYNNPKRGFVEISKQNSNAHESGWFRRLLVLFHLFTLMLFTGYYAVIVLGAHHLQHEVRDITLTSQKPITVAAFIKYRNQKFLLDETRRKSLNPIRLKANPTESSDRSNKDLGKNSTPLTSANTRLEDVRSLYQQIETNKTKGERLFIERANAPDLTGAALDELINEVRGGQVNQRALEESERSANEQACRLLQSVYAIENTFFRGYSDLLLESGFGSAISRFSPVEELKGQDGAVNEGEFLGEFSDIHAKLVPKIRAKFDCQLPKLQKAYATLNLDDNVLEPLTNYKYFIEPRASSNVIVKALDYIYLRTISTPRQLLTVLLVLSMGALGGAVDLLRRHLGAPKTLSLESIVFTPTLSMISGFAVFVLVKSGVLLIAEPNAGQSGAFLSPYFIAFIGLISGLLAKEAMDSILKVGRRLFQDASDDIQRWYIGEIAKADDIENIVRPIANLANIPNDKVAAYLKGENPTPGTLQMLIANQIGESRRRIFTDLAPLRDVEDNEEPLITPEVDPPNDVPT